MGSCHYCGNARHECSCLEAALGIVRDVISGDAAQRYDGFVRYKRLRGRFSEAQWGQWFSDAIEQRRIVRNGSVARQ